ncbi:hypothetical protein HPB49_014375 [Dermacentor silvarum]|uniref:Uncharacterized protein n=1 Tax=Dermacentor silvarum TaxID=543639 RepID=A0ACB8C459_DERSI|nr:transmembrane protein 45B-like [Dermacentor silvarum]KAH7933616.1 hypothetical protein HPB49_014375 [Dermacentor silvarum]
MGKFEGHALPGTFMLTFGTWWAFAAWRNYFRSREQKRHYACRCSYAMPCLCRRFNFEGITKIVACSICVANETRGIIQVGVTTERGYFDLMASSQHFSMYLFYVLSGVVDVMTSSGFPLPPYTDYVTLLLAVSVEGLLFHFHLHGRPPLDVLVHTLLVYTAVAWAACIVVEMCRPRSILASLGRAYFCLLQGTWFWQVGYVLYSPLPEHPPWNVESHTDMMLAASVFSWHMMALLAYLGALGIVAWAVNRTCGRWCGDDSAVVKEDDDLRQALVTG